MICCDDLCIYSLDWEYAHKWSEPPRVECQTLQALYVQHFLSFFKSDLGSDLQVKHTYKNFQWECKGSIKLGRPSFALWTSSVLYCPLFGWRSCLTEGWYETCSVVLAAPTCCGVRLMRVPQDQVSVTVLHRLLKVSTAWETMFWAQSSLTESSDSLMQKLVTLHTRIHLCKNNIAI